MTQESVRSWHRYNTHAVTRIPTAAYERRSDRQENPNPFVGRAAISTSRDSDRLRRLPSGAVRTLAPHEAGRYYWRINRGTAFGGRLCPTESSIYVAKTKTDRSRFYGVEVPPLADELCRETLTYATAAGMDLVDAHLKSNFAYFGSLDKTLSGFYILDNEGDDYTLLDLRETKGQVYFLDHEELDLALKFDALEAYAKWRVDVDRARARTEKTEEDEDAGTVALPRPPKSRGKKRPETAKLWGRYRWLVWLLAQPGQIDDEEAISTAIEIMTSTCGGDFARFGKAYETEKKQLAQDPFVAIYWLLHFACTGQDEEREEVAGLVKASRNELVRAFADTFGAMGTDAELGVLKAFRKRRSRLVFELAPKIGKNPFRLALKAFEMDANERGLDKAVAIWSHAKTKADWDRIRACVANPKLKGSGADYLRTELDALDGHPRKAAWLLEHDPYRTRFLELALAGGGDEQIAQRLSNSKKLDGLLAGVLAAAETSRKKQQTIADLDRAVAPSLKPLGKAPPELQALAARRIITRAREYPNAAIGWAFKVVRNSEPDPDRIQLMVNAVMRMDLYDAVKQAVKGATKGDEDAIALLMALLSVDERTCNEYRAKYVKQMAIEGLGERLAEPDCFAGWVPLLARPGQERLADELA